MAETIPALTTEQLIKLALESPTFDLPVAGRAYGMGKNASYEAHKRGDFPVPVLKIGKRLKVRSADVLADLGIRHPIDKGSDAA